MLQAKISKVHVTLAVTGFLVTSLAASLPLFAQETKTAPHSDAAQEFVHGAPAKPSTAWELAAGGRVYDKWWDALDKKKPATTNPKYPASGKTTGANTWRCVECHGWDYRGASGEFSKGEHYTGIKGIRGAIGDTPADIMKLLRGPSHGYTADMIPDDALRRVALFVSKGQHDVNTVRDARTGNPKGDVRRGQALFETTCAACHGFDGRLLNWGTKDDPAYVGTEANKLPWEVLHKIRNSHPGAAMINYRALPLSDAAAVLVYARTLPQK